MQWRPGLEPTAKSNFSLLCSHIVRGSYWHFKQVDDSKRAEASPAPQWIAGDTHIWTLSPVHSNYPSGDYLNLNASQPLPWA